MAGSIKVFVEAKEGVPPAGYEKNTVRYYDKEGNLLIRFEGSKAWRCEIPHFSNQSEFRMKTNFSTICLLLLPLNLFAWIPLGYQDCINSIEFKICKFETSSNHVEATISYPILLGTDAFTLYVNQSLKEDAHSRYDQHIQKMHILQENIWQEDIHREFRYYLYPIYRNQNIISIYGYEFHDWGLTHNSLRSVGRTFWQEKYLIRELTLDDLFLSPAEARSFLLQYCENYFKSKKIGYYAYENLEWPQLRADHLNTFLLTEKGLLLIFQNYVIWGMDDYPSTLLIPYATLASFVKANGPIKFTEAVLVENSLKLN